MKYRLKNLLLFLVTAMLIFSTVSVNAEIGYSTSEDNVLSKANMLMALGIMYPDNNGNFSGEKIVTRAEAVVAIIRFMGYEDITAPKETEAKSIFADVDNDFWALEDINLACMLGIVSKNADNCFRPSDAVTVAEFTKMLMTALGYSYEAEAKGGYPSGYMYVANSEKVSRGITSSFQFAADRKTVAVMLYNALTVNVRETVRINGDKQILEKRASAMEVFLGMTLSRGIVNVSENIYLSGYSKAGEGNAIIGSDFLKITEYSPEKYVGEYVEYCYKEENGEKELKYIIPIKTDNNISIAPGTDIAYNSQSRKYTVFDKKEKEYQLKYDFDVIYNGELDLSRTDMKPDNSVIDLIDNNYDGIYDIVRITEYKNYIAVSYDSDLNSLLCMGGALLDFNDVDDIKLYKNNMPAEMSDIAAGDVISASWSKNGEKLILYIKSKKLIGEFEYSESGSKRYVIFGGTEYQIADNAYCENENFGDCVSGTLYFDFADRVAGFIGDSGNMSMGYLTKMETKQGLDKTIAAKIFTTGNKFKVYTFAKKVEINGRLLQSNEREFTEMLSAVTPEEVAPQLICYDVDENGRINSMKTAIPNNPYLGELKVEQNQTKTFMLGGQTMGEYYVGNCGVFIVPFDASAAEKYIYTTTVYLVNKKDYTFDAYTFDDDLTIDALVCKSQSAADMNTVSKSKALAMVSSVREVIGGDGTTVLRLDAYLSGKLVSYYINDEMFIKTARNLRRGDVVQIDSSTEYITGFRKIYDSVHNEGMLTDATTVTTDSNVIRCGHITKLEGTVFKFLPADCDKDAITSNIYDYDISTTYADYGKLSEATDETQASTYNMSTRVHIFQHSGRDDGKIYTISQNQLANLLNTDNGEKYFVVMRLSEGATKDIFIYIN